MPARSQFSQQHLHPLGPHLSRRLWTKLIYVAWMLSSRCPKNPNFQRNSAPTSKQKQKQTRTRVRQSASHPQGCWKTYTKPPLTSLPTRADSRGGLGSGVSALLRFSSTDPMGRVSVRPSGLCLGLRRPGVLLPLSLPDSPTSRLFHSHSSSPSAHAHPLYPWPRLRRGVAVNAFLELIPCWRLCLLGFLGTWESSVVFSSIPSL